MRTKIRLNKRYEGAKLVENRYADSNVVLDFLGKFEVQKTQLDNVDNDYSEKVRNANSVKLNAMSTAEQNKKSAVLNVQNALSTAQENRRIAFEKAINHSQVPAHRETFANSLNQYASHSDSDLQRKTAELEKKVKDLGSKSSKRFLGCLFPIITYVVVLPIIVLFLSFVLKIEDSNELLIPVVVIIVISLIASIAWNVRLRNAPTHHKKAEHELNAIKQASYFRGLDSQVAQAQQRLNEVVSRAESEYNNCVANADNQYAETESQAKSRHQTIRGNLEQQVRTLLSELTAYLSENPIGYPQLQATEKNIKTHTGFTTLIFPAIKCEERDRLVINNSNSITNLVSGFQINMPKFDDMSESFSMRFTYNSESERAEKNSNIQSILASIINSRPMGSFELIMIDYVGMGASFGALQNFQNIGSVSGKIYTKPDEIKQRLVRLTDECVEISRTISTAGKVSVAEYNKTTTNIIPSKILVVIGYAPSEHNTEDVRIIENLAKNAEIFGISIISSLVGNVNTARVFDIPGKVMTISNGKVLSNGRSFPFVFTNYAELNTFIQDAAKAYTQSTIKTDVVSAVSKEDYKDATDGIKIPFATGKGGALEYFELGSNTHVHGFISGATRSGKSTLMHTIISAVIAQYHPDDVEIWVADCKLVEFKYYLDRKPAHMGLIGLDTTDEFAIALLEHIMKVFRQRQELFKQANVVNIREYRAKFVERSMPRILLIIDEFHVIAQSIAPNSNKPEYGRVLENILSEFAAFGLSILLSDQSSSKGLQGLSEKSKDQIMTRIAMKSTVEEICDTLGGRREDWKDAAHTLSEGAGMGELLFKSRKGTILKAIYTPQEEREHIIKESFTKAEGYTPKNIVIHNGDERKEWNYDFITNVVRAIHYEDGLPVVLGQPSTFDECFSFEMTLGKRNQNMIVVGDDDKFQSAVVLSVAASITACSQKTQVYIFADRRSKIYKNCSEQFELLSNNGVVIQAKTSEIVSTVNTLADKVRNQDGDVETFALFLGAEELFEDIRDYETDNGGTPAPAQEPFNPFAMPTETVTSTATKSVGFFENLDVILNRGSRSGVTAYFAFESTSSAIKILRNAQIKANPSMDLFRHKIAFRLNSTELSELIGYKAKFDYADGVTATYTDDRDRIRLFKPYVV
jgi:hypothetical protein